MQINVENSPSNCVAPGEEITYNIDYRNLGPGTASSPLIQAMIPVSTEFVSGSSVRTESSITSTTAGGTIRWNLDAMNASQAGTLTYKVRRVAAASNQPPSALSISLDGPIAATAGQPINYTLTITNQAIQLDNAVITVHVPDEAEYVSSSNNGVFSNGVITWQAPTFPVATLSVNFALSASATFVLHEYRVEAEVPPPGGPAITRGIGSSLLVTAIDGLPHTGNGDGITIVNDEIRISWNYNGNPAAFTALGVQNPSLLDEKIFLPYLTQ